MRTFGFFALLLVMCGGQSSGDNLEPQESLVRLSSDESAQLCDWLAGLYGGYGKSVSCDGGSGGLNGPQDQASCVQQWPQGAKMYANCPLTVQEFEACMQWEVDNACVASPGTPPAAYAILMSAQCSG
jgi:hypothetical protein